MVKDLTRNLIGQGDKSDAMLEGESDELLLTRRFPVPVYRRSRDGTLLRFKFDGRYEQAFTLHEATEDASDQIW
jgi:hypothetical protein